MVKDTEKMIRVKRKNKRSVRFGRKLSFIQICFFNRYLIFTLGNDFKYRKVRGSAVKSIFIEHEITCK